MASKCICETLYDKCIEDIRSSLKKRGSVIIDRLDSANPCNNKMIQHMVDPYLQSYIDDPKYRVKVENIRSINFYTADNRDTVVSIAISDKRIFG